jgi:hypothetical protein
LALRENHPNLSDRDSKSPTRCTEVIRLKRHISLQSAPAFKYDQYYLGGTGSQLNYKTIKPSKDSKRLAAYPRTNKAKAI